MEGPAGPETAARAPPRREKALADVAVVVVVAVVVDVAGEADGRQCCRS